MYRNGLLKVKPHEEGDFDSSACLLKRFEVALGTVVNNDRTTDEERSRGAEGAYTVLPKRLVC